MVGHVHLWLPWLESFRPGSKHRSLGTYKGVTLDSRLETPVYQDPRAIVQRTRSDDKTRSQKGVHFTPYYSVTDLFPYVHFVTCHTDSVPFLSFLLSLVKIVQFTDFVVDHVFFWELLTTSKITRKSTGSCSSVWFWRVPDFPVMFRLPSDFFEGGTGGSSWLIYRDVSPLKSWTWDGWPVCDPRVWS